ncbi:MAG TPA: 2'-5' RNA ligase family protein [Candidatus Nanoarchaeia archaeon]|nr:2'-5' RNA ligase family protein [Candidatus Nanoarchaeia archaeon]
MIRRVYCSIVLPFQTRKRVEKLQRRLLKITKTKQTHNPPHISIRTSFYTDQLEEYIKALKSFAKNCRPFSLKTTGHAVFAKRCLVLKVNKPDSLKQLEKELILLSEPYCSKRPRISGEKLRYFKKYGNPLYLKKYGDPFIFEFYNPHITLIYDLGDKQKEVTSLLNREKPVFSFKVDHITVVEKTNKYRIIKHIAFR